MRMRLFPLLIFSCCVMLTLKVGSVWQGIASRDPGALFQEQQAVAQEQPAGEEAEALAPPSLDEDGGLGGEDDVPDDYTRMEFADEDDVEFGDLANLSSGEIRLLHDLAKRRKELDSRERHISEREALLRGAEQQIIEKQRQLGQIKAEIESLLGEFDKHKTDENKKLVGIYSNMKPKSAAAIFNDMDMDTLLQVLRGMNTRKIAPIMAAMNPEKSRLVTRELSEDRELPELPQ